MIINPVIIIILATIYISVLVYCIINRPNKPIFTGVSIFMLLIFIGFTYLINLGISGNSSETQNEFTKFMLSILVSNYNEVSTVNESAFDIYSGIDIFLMFMCLISMIIEVKALFSETAKIKKIKEKIKKKEKEINDGKNKEKTTIMENEI